MTFAHDIILSPVITEQSTDMMAERKYTFKVKLDANKIQIAKAIEEIFGVSVEKVTTIRRDGKLKRRGRNEGRRPAYKKAVVKLSANSKNIELFEGMA